MTAAAIQLAFNPNHVDDATLIQALADGHHSQVLQAYFGPAYGELSTLAQQAQAITPHKQAPLVYLLPGLLGSKLGAHTRSGDEALWLDPAAVVSGKLTQLAIGKRRSIRALGIMLPGYLKLMLTLQAAGLRVKVHAYDWRRSVQDLGNQFAEQLLHETAPEVMIVAHSMGGLVARVALKQLAGAKVTRVIQLGTPNLGSFALVQALRGCYPTVRKLGAVDQTHCAEIITQQVFHSFNSFYEMLPARAHSHELNLFDLRVWPQDALLPNAARLKYGRRLPRHLAAADRRCHVIVGMAQLTVCGLRRAADEFIFQYAHAGDGTVPTALAQWPGAMHWYVNETHGLLPRNSSVCQATVELLQGETTGQLSQQPAAAVGTPLEKSERELRVLNCKVRWDQLPLHERRELLEPVISSSFSALCIADALP